MNAPFTLESVPPPYESTSPSLLLLHISNQELSNSLSPTTYLVKPLLFPYVLRGSEQILKR